MINQEEAKKQLNQFLALVRQKQDKGEELTDEELNEWERLSIQANMIDGTGMEDD